jgi:hydroxymethylpyrimidine pyrophosphatase-like HAD family hydrolase
MKYKLIVSDLDDTLLNDNLIISDKNRQAVADYIAAGGVFTIATGRMTKPMLDICKDLHLRGEAISYQGAVVTDVFSGRTVEETGIPNAVALELCHYLDKLNVYYQVYEGSKIHIKRLTSWSELYKNSAIVLFMNMAKILSAI